MKMILAQPFPIETKGSVKTGADSEKSEQEGKKGRSCFSVMTMVTIYNIGAAYGRHDFCHIWQSPSWWPWQSAMCSADHIDGLGSTYQRER